MRSSYGLDDPRQPPAGDQVRFVRSCLGLVER